jgi:hypothetical protein
VATVIDSLVVLLGLDASNYKKGRETAEKETGETARKAQQSADAITKSLAEVGRTIAGLFLGFESVTGLTKWLGGLNAGEAALGRTAANIGMSAHELNKWGSAARLAGGDASDAQSAFSKLTEDFQTMSTGAGPPSALLELLRNRGVNIRDQNGNLRDQGEILEELADKTAQYGRQYQITMFKAAGLSAGEANYLAQSKQLREDQLRLAEQNNNVDADSIAKAQALQEYWRNIGEQIEGVGQKILQEVTPAITAAFTQASKLMGEFKDTGGLDRIAQAMRVISAIAGAIGDSIKFWAGAVNDSLIGKYFNFMFKLYGKGLDLLDPGAPTGAAAPATVGGVATPTVPPDTGITYRNHNPGNLRPYRAGQPVDSRGIRTFGNDAEGKQALDDDLRAKLKEGLNTISAIITKYAPSSENDTTGYISDVSQRLGKNANATLSEADIRQLAAAITAHEGAQIKTAKAAGGNTTTVQVDKIEVHSNSADPRAVAEQVPGAIQRKFSVAQADTGQS